MDTEKGWMYASSGHNSESCRSDNVMFSGARLRERNVCERHVCCFLSLKKKKVTLIVQSHCLSVVVDSLNNF